MYFLLPVRRVWISRYIERFKGVLDPRDIDFTLIVFSVQTHPCRRERIAISLNRIVRTYIFRDLIAIIAIIPLNPSIYRFTSKILIIPSSRLIILLHLKKISLFQFLIFNSDRRISICVIGNNNNFKWKVKILIVTRWLVIINYNKFKYDRQYIFGGREPPVNLRNHQCVIVRRSGRKCSRFSSLIL